MPRSASYSTKARQGIMRCLEESSASTISVSDILGYLSERGLSVSPTTVYRYLDKLCLERRVIKYVAKKGEKNPCFLLLAAVILVLLYIISNRVMKEVEQQRKNR